MEKDELKSVRELMSALINPTLSQFLDRTKFCRSIYYHLAIEAALQQASKYGNLTQLNVLLAIVDGTGYASVLIHSAQSKLKVNVTDSKPRKFTMVNPAKRGAGVQNAAAPRSANKAEVTISIRRYENEERSQDLMDSRLMLPGSYGMGRRR